MLSGNHEGISSTLGRASNRQATMQPAALKPSEAQSCAAAGSDNVRQARSSMQQLAPAPPAGFVLVLVLPQGSRHRVAGPRLLLLLVRRAKQGGRGGLGIRLRLPLALAAADAAAPGLGRPLIITRRAKQVRLQLFVFGHGGCRRPAGAVQAAGQAGEDGGLGGQPGKMQ